MKKKISDFSLDQLLTAAIKGEIESNRIYKKVASQVRNAFLKERLLFLAREEMRHKQTLQKLFRELFPGKKAVVPKKSIVPLPEINVKGESIPLSELFKQAMKVEKETAGFYRMLATDFLSRAEHKNLLLYLSSMELGHYRIFELEKDNLLELEEYDQEIPLIHVGP